MKNPIPKATLAMTLPLAILSIQPATLHAQGTAFTYQGQLNAGGLPANGQYDLDFRLFATDTGGTPLASVPSTTSVGISNGLFAVTLDFGGGGFPGADRWLEIAVRTNGASGFSTLTPRQPITAAPYAITAGNLTGTVSATGLSGNYSNAITFSNAANSFAGNGAGLADVNAATLGGLSSSNFWRITGNTDANPANGAFLGTTDNLPLEMQVNGRRGFRLEPAGSNCVNLIGGYVGNYVEPGVVGATIGGGGAGDYYGEQYTNKVVRELGVEGGDFATVSGGYENTGSGYSATVGGGNGNTSSGENATIGGGRGNTSDGYIATVGGGAGNYCGDLYTTVGGGVGNTANGEEATVGGGSGNTATGARATVSGGTANTAGGSSATIGGGWFNSASGSYATLSGGRENIASGQYAMVIGGYSNVASGNFSFAAGIGAKALHQGSFVWADDYGGAFASTANNQFSVRAIGGVRIAADVALSGGNDYHNLSLSGGNALGYLYGSFPKFGDGVHVGYNYYADASGGNHVFNSGGATSRMTVGYGFVGLYVGGVNAVPSTQRLLADSTGVTVYGTFNNVSDRNVKQDFASVSPSQILDKLLQLPVSEWSYKEDPATRHVGPVAQDFFSAFKVGTDDKHIAPLDESGIALAAIQGLNEKLELKEARVRELEKTVGELKELVDKLAASRSGGAQ